jgi:hypothetical protein
MEKIILMKNAEKFEYPSINQATRENGALSGMNRENAIKFLEKRGFEIVSIEKSQSENGIIEKLVKLTSKLDKDLIAKLENDLNEQIANLKMGSDISKIVELKTRIENAKKPQTNLNAILEKVKELYNEYNGNENE